MGVEPEFYLTKGGAKFDTQPAGIGFRRVNAGVLRSQDTPSGEIIEMPMSPPIASAKTTTKKELVDRVAAETNQPRAEVKRTIQAFLDGVIEELGRGHRLEFRDFGVFEIRERAARRAQNPKTLELVDIPARKTVKFKTGRLMKVRIDDSELDGTDDE